MSHWRRQLTTRLWPVIALVMLAAAPAMTAMTAQAQEPPANAVDPLPFKDHAQEVRFQKLTRQLRCLVCQDESLAASNADLARQMRHIVFEQMQKGRSNQQIKDYLVDRYSDYVLYKPPLKPATWLLWFGPMLILLAGAGVVFVVVRRRRTEHVPELADVDDDDW
jgi:cytochrome c-type biogenesis protein CcmH